MDAACQVNFPFHRDERFTNIFNIEVLNLLEIVLPKSFNLDLSWVDRRMTYT